KEARRRVESGPDALGQVAVQPRGVLTALQALAEGSDVEPDGLSVSGQLFAGQVGLVGEESRVHGPERPAFPGAMGRLGRLERVGVNLLEREVANHVLHATGLDVRLLDLGHRLTDVPG